MKIAIMQPYFFPYIGYFQLISAVDKFIIYDDVNFINKGWINRNNILVNGKAGLISVPLNGASQNRLIKDIAPILEQKWRNVILKTIEQNYKKAPQFNNVFSLLNQTISTTRITNMSEFNYLGIKSICDFLGIMTSIIPSSEIYKNNELKGQYRILDICKIENASNYLNPIGGIEMYSRDLFHNEGIVINFVKSDLPSYKQFDENFIPGLSIIDILMFNDKNEIREMLNKYQLK